MRSIGGLRDGRGVRRNRRSTPRQSKGHPSRRPRQKLRVGRRSRFPSSTKYEITWQPRSRLTGPRERHRGLEDCHGGDGLIFDMSVHACTGRAHRPRYPRNVRIKFTAIKVDKGSGYQGTSELKAVDVGTGRRLQYSVGGWISLLSRGHVAYMVGSRGREYAVAVKRDGVAVWLQSHDCGVWTDDILSLDRY